jgi:hypothetical protein
MPLKQIILGPALSTSFLLSALLYKIAKDEIKDHFPYKLKEKHIQITTILLGIVAGVSIQFEFNQIPLIIYALGLLLPALFVYKNKILTKSILYFFIFLIPYEISYIIISSL